MSPSPTAFYHLMQVLMAAVLVTIGIGGGVRGIPGVPRGELDPGGLTQRPRGFRAGDVHLGADLAVVIDPFGVPAA